MKKLLFRTTGIYVRKIDPTTITNHSSSKLAKIWEITTKGRSEHAYHLFWFSENQEYLSEKSYFGGTSAMFGELLSLADHHKFRSKFHIDFKTIQFTDHSISFENDSHSYSGTFPSDDILFLRQTDKLTGKTTTEKYRWIPDIWNG